MADKKLSVVITGDASGAKKAFSTVEDSADGLTGKLSGLGSKISPGMAAAAGAVVAGVGLMMKGAFDAAEESAKIGRETERVIKSTGAAAWTSAESVSNYAGKLSGLTGVDDEVIQSGENLLLTFTNVQNKMGAGNKVFDRATAAALDMSAALGTDMSSASVSLGKALNDPIRGLTVLGKQGVSFTTQQKEQVKAMVAVGDTLGAQKIILGELEKEFSGAAAAAASPLDRLKVQLGNLQESLGATLIPIVAGAADKLSGLVAAFSALPGPVQTGVVALGGLTAGLAGTIVVVAKLTEKLAPVFSAVRPMVDSASLGVATFANKLGMSSDSALKLGQNLGTALGAAGVLAAGAIAAWTIWNAKIHETDDQIKGLTEQVKDKAAGMSMSELGDYIGKVRTESQGLSDTIKNSSAPWDADYRNQLRQGRDELDQTADSIQAMSDQAYALSFVTGRSADEAWQWLNTEKAAGREYSSNAALLAAFTGQTDSYALSAKEAAFAAQSQAEAIRDASNATKAAVDPFFAASDATTKLEQAQVAAYLASLQYKQGSPEVAAANEAVARAALNTEGAYATLAAQMKENGSTSDEMKAAFQRWVDQGWITQGAADQLMGKFGGLAAKADEVSAKNVAVEVSAPGLYGVSSGIDDLINKLDAANSKGMGRIQSIIATGYGQANVGFASGGKPDNGWFTVGEQGPELAYKDGSSLEIFSNSTSSKMLAGGSSGGGGVSVVIHMPPGSNGEDVVDAIRRYEQRNGTAWRN